MTGGEGMETGRLEAAKPTIVLPAPERPGLLEAWGVEIEYVIADAESLDVRPICDRLLERVAGAPVAEVERGAIAWSNELTLHVLELKTNGPAPALEGLAAAFQESVADANRHLADLGARLLPGGMHPWMDPGSETRLWPHEYNEVYRTFDRIFGCSGHGWANLQSTHLNLPFSGDEEFGRLHAAVRLVLPLVPALAASSPFVEGRRGPALDTRLAMYRGNARRVPSVTGSVVPEAVFSRAEYERAVLGRIYGDLAELDPEGVLRHEWVNARGAIARFDRGTVEVRLIDAQECPSADLAVTAAVAAVVRMLAVGRGAERDPRADPDETALARLLDRTIVAGEGAVLDDPRYLRALGLENLRAQTAGAVWRALLERDPPDDPRGEWGAALETILARGTLARRLLRAAGADEASTERPVPTSELRAVYRDLASCLEAGTPFEP